MEISKEQVEAEVANVQPTKEQIAQYEHQQKEMLKERKKRLKVLKEDVEWMETNYKYMQLRMALPDFEYKYKTFLQKEEEAFAQHQAVKENMDNAEGPVIENKVEETEIPIPKKE